MKIGCETENNDLFQEMCVTEARDTDLTPKVDPKPPFFMEQKQLSVAGLHPHPSLWNTGTNELCIQESWRMSDDTLVPICSISVLLH